MPIGTSKPETRLPLVGIPCDIKQIDIHPFHAVGEKYINAIAHGSHAMPVLLPCFGAGTDLEPLEYLYSVDDILDRVDGIFLPGSPSNVHPELYNGHDPRRDTLLDRQRDSLTLPLILSAVERDLPLFAVCRGIQELNAALGGTLYQHLDEVPGKMKHREDTSRPREEQYAPSHMVEFVRGGLLNEITGLETARVNSLHGQGIDNIAPGLVVEARAPDGHVEAVRVDNTSAFQLGVQWHPEWKFRERDYDHALFEAFGKALRSDRSDIKSVNQRTSTCDMQQIIHNARQRFVRNGSTNSVLET